MGRSERSARASLPPSGGAPPRLLGRRWRGSTWQVRRALGGKLRPRVAKRTHCRSPPPRGARSWVWSNPRRGAQSWVWSNPLGAPVRAPWPYRLGGVSRHPPGTPADPPRPRLRQWVAVSAASETACRRAAVHLPACPATGGPVRRRSEPRGVGDTLPQRVGGFVCFAGFSENDLVLIVTIGHP